MAVKEWFRRLQPVQIYIVLFFTVAFFFVEIIISQANHALTLLLNAYHMFCNILALLGCIASIKYGKQNMCKVRRSQCGSLANSSICFPDDDGKQSPTNLPELQDSCSDLRMKNTFGWARIEILTLLVCCVFLTSFCFTLLLEALQTLVHIDHLDEMHRPILVMIIGFFGILLNAFCYMIIGGYTFNQGLLLHVTKDGNLVLQRNKMNDAEVSLTSTTRRSPLAISQRQGCQEMCRDVLGCILVVISSTLIYISDRQIAKFVDPIFAIISAISLFLLSYRYLKEAGLILLQTIPNHINIDSMKKELLVVFPGIVNVHDLHVWQLAGDKIISTVHIIFLDQNVYSNISEQITSFFMEMGITQVTIQPEFQQFNGNHDECLIRCLGGRCARPKCCSKDELLKEVISDQRISSDDKTFKDLNESDLTKSQLNVEKLDSKVAEGLNKQVIDEKFKVGNESDKINDDVNNLENSLTQNEEKVSNLS